MTESPSSAHESYKAQITIERALPEDAVAIMTIKRDAWLGAYVSEEHGITTEDIHKKMGDLSIGIDNWSRGIATETGDGERVTFVARMGGKVIGYTAPCIEDGQRRVGALYVTPEAQGQGIGGQLLAKTIEWHGRDEDIYLHVVSYNDRAIEFYEHYGFEKTGVESPEQFDEQQVIKLLPEIEMVLRAKDNEKS